jgi:hypothetical protein
MKSGPEQGDRALDRDGGVAAVLEKNSRPRSVHLSRLTPPPQIHPPRFELHFGDHHSTPAKPPPLYNPTMDSGASGLSSPSGPTPEARTEQWERGRRARSSPACAAWERPSSPAGLSLSPRESLFGVGVSLFLNY